MGKKIPPDIEDDLLTDMGHDAGPDGIEHDADDDDEHKQERELDEQHNVFVWNGVVEHPFHNFGLEQSHNAGDRAEKQGEPHLDFVPSDVLHGAFQMTETKRGFEIFIDFKGIACHQNAPPFTAASSGRSSGMSFWRA